MKFLLDLLRDPSLDNIDVNGQNRLVLHSKMLERKRMLREVFTEFHYLFCKLVHSLRFCLSAFFGQRDSTRPIHHGKRLLLAL